MFGIFGGQSKQVICPYDLTDIRYKKPVDKCPSCKTDLPKLYVQEFNNIQPFFIQMMGWSGVGKTVYLQALTLMLLRLNAVWHRFTSSPLTDPTLRFIRDVRTFIANNDLPQATQLELQQAYMMHLQNMERWGNRTLVLRDVAGEHFEGDEIKFPLEYTPYLLNVPVTFMMISIDDLMSQVEKDMNDLLNSYVHTLTEANVNVKSARRKIIVVLSKADLFMDSLPEPLRNYMMNDPLAEVALSDQLKQPWDAYRMDAYMQDLRKVSNAVSQWLRSTNAAARQLMAQADTNNIDLEFAIVSSTGGTPTGNMQLKPIRVMDPFFWALDMQSY